MTMRNLALTVACLLVPVGVMLAQVMEKPIVRAEAGKTENCARVETDGKVWRAWIVIDKDHSAIAKFQAAPTAADIKAVRDKMLAQEASATAEVAEAKLQAAKADDLKAQGKCPTCGQPLPLKEGEE
jgi:uncharacterized protein YqcC (DUF446 family)